MIFLLLLPVELGIPSDAQKFSETHKHWRETATETVYVGRYSNCDYGYSVDLPNGTIAHGTKSPNPNHGVVIDLSAPQDDRAFPPDSKRFISIFNAYDTSESKSIRQLFDYEIGLATQDKKDFKILERKSVWISGLSAVHVRISFLGSTGPVRQDEIVAYRPPGRDKLGNIVYSLSLVSPESTFEADRKAFELIVDGFRVTKLPLGECSND